VIVHLVDVGGIADYHYSLDNPVSLPYKK